MIMICNNNDKYYYHYYDTPQMVPRLLGRGRCLRAGRPAPGDPGSPGDIIV